MNDFPLPDVQLLIKVEYEWSGVETLFENRAELAEVQLADMLF